MRHVLATIIDLVLNPIITLFGLGPCLDEQTLLNDPVVLELARFIIGGPSANT